MKKKTQRILSRIILGAFALLILSLIICPILASDSPSAEETVPTVPTTIPTEISVPETTEEVTESIPETTAPTIEPETTVTLTEPTQSIEIMEEEVTPSAYTYSEYELDLLARLVRAEGGGESYETMLKIASVVMNRVDDPNFPNTIEGVIYAKNQFSVTVIKKDGIAMIDHPATEESLRAAKYVLDHGSVLPPKVQVFYATYCTESWVTSREVYGVFDSTVFAYIYAKTGS